MIVSGKDILGSVREDVDVCIIGSGAGGATAARELAQLGLRVVVLEEGPVVSSKDFVGSNIKEAFKHLYRNTGADTTTGIPSILVASGKCLGGTTVVNMGTCFRAPDRILNGWKEQGLTEYGPEGLAPLYDEVEEEMSVQPVKPEVMGRGGQIIAEGATKLGLHPRPIRRNVNNNCHGCGNCAYGCEQDAKQSMILNAIPDAVKAGAVFYCDTRAETLVHDGERITGVHGRVVTEDGCAFHPVDIAAKAVIMSAGALHTPSLMRKNGVGGNQVGRNLKLHLCFRTIGIFDEIIDSFHGVCQNLFIDDYVDQGIMLESTFTGPASQMPGIVGVGKDLWDIAKNYRHMASVGIMISEKGTGRVRADGEGNPIMTFSVTKGDAETLHKAMIIADRILFMAGAKRVINGNFEVPTVEKMADLDVIARKQSKASDFLMMAFHPQGSCRMGVNPKKSVVGPDGQCHQMKNLYLADASIFPTSLGVNPQETIWALTKKISRGIARDVFGK